MSDLEGFFKKKTTTTLKSLYKRKEPSDTEEDFVSLSKQQILSNTIQSLNRLDAQKPFHGLQWITGFSYQIFGIWS